MKKPVTVLAAALFFCVGFGMVRSQQLATPPACAGATTQMQLNLCSAETSKAVDVQENAVYQSILSIAAQTPGAAAKVKHAEALWRQYRSAYIDATWPKPHTNANYGSILPLLVNEMYADMTRKHIVDLQRLLAVYSNPGYFVCASHC